MKRLAVAATVAVALLAVGYDWLSQRGVSGVVVKGNEPVEVKELLGKTPLTLVHLWATWCPPCLQEMPGLLAELKKPQPGLTVVMVNLDGNEAKREAFYVANDVRARGMGVRWVEDPSQTLSVKLVNPVKLPTTLVYARNGAVVQRVDSVVAWDSFMAALRARAAAMPSAD